jgi:hypothetical protein
MRYMFVIIGLLAALSPELALAERLRLHVDNPHYLEFRGKPTVLITSGEHYGAVLNLDFDFIPYLNELKAHGLNLTRTFSGVYCEAPGNFNIENNTLAPAPERLICPWARSDQPGYAGGGNKFDLSRWNGAYFERLKAFVDAAGERGIVVELVLFCPFYEDSMWRLSPLNAANNVNRVGNVARTDVYGLKDAPLSQIQEDLVRKLAAELAEFDNLYFEVCNEPYFGAVTMAFQDHVIAALMAAEKDLPAKHLIAQNIANGTAKIEVANPGVSIFNFHYATPPNAVALNFDLNKAIGDDETGFRGSDDDVYRGEGWDFILAGGTVFDNLDYSFTTDHEDGTAAPHAPGGGGRELRRKLGALKSFIESFDFIHMAPDVRTVRGGVPDGTTARVLSQPGKQYAVYLRGGHAPSLRLDLPAGRYEAEWVNTRNGKVEKTEELDHSGGEVALSAPGYEDDIALRVTAPRRSP